MTYLVPRMTQREMQKALDALKAPLRFPRAEGGFVPPTEPRDQEHDMPTPHRLTAEHCLSAAEMAENAKETSADAAVGQLHALLAIHDRLTSNADRAHDEQVEQTATLHATRDVLRDVAGNTYEIHATLDDRLPPGQDWVVKFGGEAIGRVERPEDDWLDEPTPAEDPRDVTEEPPAGSQVTDREGDVWEQVGAGWQSWDRTASMWGGRTGWGSAVGPRAYAPLRLTTDTDRERVGIAPSLHRLEDVAEEFGVDLDAPDVDPDEALAKVLWQYLPDEDDEWAETYADESNVTKHQMQVAARAAREHIEARVSAHYATLNDAAMADLRERAEYAEDRCELTRQALLKAEADVERLTRERDEARVDAANDRKALTEAIQRYEALRAEVERLTRERDNLRNRVDDLIRERGRAIQRYRALRQDAVGEHLHARDGSKAEASLAYVLDRDDERGRDA